MSDPLEPQPLTVIICHVAAGDRPLRPSPRSSQVILSSEPSIQPSLQSLANVYIASYDWRYP